MKKVFIISEVIEPKKVKGVRYSKRIHNKGTNIATELHTWKFKTSKGNEVEIIFKPTSGDRAYDVSFFVNEEMSAQKSGGDSDKEILAGVFTLLPKLADKLGAQNLTMESYDERLDQRRTLKGLDYKKVEKDFTKEFERLLSEEEDEALRQKLRQTYNHIFVDKDWDISGVYTFIGRQGQKYQKLNNLFKDYRDAYLSNQEGGYEIKVNRRYNIYKQLIPRFMKDWEIYEYPNYFYFELKRKVVQEGRLLEQELFSSFFDESEGLVSDDGQIEELGQMNSDDVYEKAYSLAYNLGVGITRDRELKYVIFDKDNENLLVGALFTSLEPSSLRTKDMTFSFDVVVHRKYQKTGIGTHLIEIAIREYQSFANEFDGVRLRVDVINSIAKSLLSKKFNFRVIKRLGTERWLMAPKK